MPTIHISVANKMATRKSGQIVSGNDDYTVQFTFDAEWEGVPDKIARFIYDGGHYDVFIDAQGASPIPRLRGRARALKIGVYSKTNSSRRTTTSATVEVVPSVLDENSSESGWYKGEAPELEGYFSGEITEVALPNITTLRDHAFITTKRWPGYPRLISQRSENMPFTSACPSR